MRYREWMENTTTPNMGQQKQSDANQISHLSLLDYRPFLPRALRTPEHSSSARITSLRFGSPTLLMRGVANHGAFVTVVKDPGITIGCSHQM